MDRIDTHTPPGESDRAHWQREILDRHIIVRQTVAGIAHELNQPLNALTTLGAAAQRILQRMPDAPPALREAVDGMLAGAQRAGGVAHKLLAYLQQPDMEIQPVELLPLLRRTIEQARRSRAFGGRMEISSVLATASVWGNAFQIEKVFLNLLNNAIDACAEETSMGQLACLHTRIDDRGETLCVCLTDNGPGIAFERRAELFQPFNSTRRGGIGMGLAISRALIETMAGRLWHEPVAGGGARFCFELRKVTTPA